VRVSGRLKTLRHSRWKNRRKESARKRERTSEIRIREKKRKRINRKAEKGKKEREPLLHCWRRLLRAMAVSPLPLAPPSPSSSAGCSSCTITCCTRTTGSRRTSRPGVQQWTISGRTGQQRPRKRRSPSYTCCGTHWSLPSATASWGARPRRRSLELEPSASLLGENGMTLATSEQRRKQASRFACVRVQ
jgi:hypothetical protein